MYILLTENEAPWRSLITVMQKTVIFIVYNLMVKPLIYADVINPKTSFIFFTNYKFLFFLGGGGGKM